MLFLPACLLPTKDSGESPLTLATRAGGIDMIELLLSHGAEVNVTVPSGDSPLTIACSAGLWVAASVLLTAGADCDVKNKVRIVVTLEPCTGASYRLSSSSFNTLLNSKA